MNDNYAKIVHGNLEKMFNRSLEEIVRDVSGVQEKVGVVFNAFGQTCAVRPDGVTLGDKPQNSVLGIIISLYGLHAKPEPCMIEPFKSFKELPNSMPYTGAFTTHTELPLVPHVEKIEQKKEELITFFGGQPAPESVSGDFALIVFPLPKIALCYIFYKADEDFPASVTCLFSSNAQAFMPTDGLADVGEYTSKAIIERLG